MANTASYSRWSGPSEQAVRDEPFRNSYRSPFHPGWIVLTVLGFIFWWPVGLAILFFTLRSKNMGCWSGSGRFERKMERMRQKMESRGFGFGPSASGNRAFDEYRVETLKRLEEEQHQFKDFLDRLRHAKDKEEFDAFMSQQRGGRTTPPNDPPQPQG